MTSHPEFTLYYHPNACSLAVRITLNELSLPFTSISMGLTPNGIEPSDGSLTAVEYKAQVHHMGYVPALTFTDPATGKKEVILELPAILTYLTSLVPAQNEKLAGKTALERTKIYSWLGWFAATVHAQAFGAFFRPERFFDSAVVADADTAKKAVLEAAKKKAVTCFESIERRISDSGNGTVLGGEGLTLADINAYIFWRWGNTYGFDMSKYTKYASVAKRVEALGATKKAMDQEGLELLAV